MSDTRPSDRRKTKTRQDIIETAHNMIIERGIEGLSLRAVAEQIDYSPAALYRYFASKEELLDAVRGQCFEQLNTLIFMKLQDVTDPAEQLFLGGIAYIEYAQQHPADYHLMFHMHGSPATQGENHATAMRALLYIVRNGLEMGIFTTRDGYSEDAMVYHCWGIVHGLAMLQTTVMHDEQQTITQVREVILRKVIAGFTVS